MAFGKRAAAAERQFNDRVAAEVARIMRSQRPVAAERPVSGTAVYALAGAGLVRIGYTRDLAERLHELQYLSPVPLRLLGAFKGDQAEQRRVLARLKRWRRHGEWVEQHPEVVEVVRELNSRRAGFDRAVLRALNLALASQFASQAHGGVPQTTGQTAKTASRIGQPMVFDHAKTGQFCGVPVIEGEVLEDSSRAA